MIGIYKITSPTNRVYIGQSVNIKRRFDAYRLLRCKHQPAIYNSLLKHGFEEHKFEVLEECEASELNNRERHYQDLYCVLGSKGLNCVLTKSNDKSGKHSEETKLKIGAKAEGRKASNETKAKMVLSHKNRLPKSQETRIKLSIANTGKAFSEDRKKNISISLIGFKHSAESKKNMGLSRLGNKHSEESKLKIGLGNKGKVISKAQRELLSSLKKGVKLSEEIKLKISESKKGIPVINRRKIILDIQTGVFYFGLEEATKIYGINMYTLSDSLRGKNKNKTSLRYV